MSAAAANKPVLSYLFFYTYRISIGLVIMPITLSFIIQTFVAKRKQFKGDKSEGVSMKMPNKFVEVYLKEVSINQIVIFMCLYRSFHHILFQFRSMQFDDGESFEEYKIRAYPGTANLSLWAIQGREMYSKNDVKIVNDSKKSASKRVSILDDPKALGNMSAAKEALFVKVPTKKGIRTTIDQSTDINIADKIHMINRSELEKLYMDQLEELQRLRATPKVSNTTPMQRRR